ncbi:MAG: phenylalanine--tRNA ligase subunit beta [Bacteriovoracaceae bacterium]
MLVSLNWIKDFVNVPTISPKEFGQKFTLSVAEVEEVLVANEIFTKIKVAKILSIRKHPEAEKLNLVTFQYGSKETETKEVVCGATNVRVGLKVPYAGLGLLLPNGMLLEAKKIRGVLSEGMLCSAEELGMTSSIDGLLELAEDAVVGSSLSEHLKLGSDIILNIDNKSLTHRPDLWGYLGMAREVATVFNTPLNNPYDSNWENKLKALFSNENSPIKPVVERDSAGLIYLGLTVKNVMITESPDWLKNRLNSVGIRSINSIVDISNYVMIELGIPLHIFDLNKISGKKIHIKKLTESTKFKTLDEVERELIPGDTVIADDREVLVLAGIMGGLSSSVTNDTKDIFIEVANWHAASVRRTSVRLGLRSESSQRYEKSLDSNQCYRTLLRTLELVKNFNPNCKVVGKVEGDGVDFHQSKAPLKIKTSVERIEKYLGTVIGEERVLTIFKALDFKIDKIQEADFKLELTVPTYRCTKDIEFEADLIEEIGRMIGFDNIAPLSPLTDIKPVKLSLAKQLHRKTQDFFVNRTKSIEVLTYPLVGEKLIQDAYWGSLNEGLQLFNPLSAETDRMRPSLVPSLVNLIGLNAKTYSAFKFFEIGRSYLPDSKNFNLEKNHLGVVYFSKSESSEHNFMSLVNDIEEYLKFINVSFDFSYEINDKFPNKIIPETWKGRHPFEYINIRIMGKVCGGITSLHPILMKDLKIKGAASICIIDLAELEEKNLKYKHGYKPISKFQTSLFDYTIKVDRAVFAGQILNVLNKIKRKELVSHRLLDVYNLNETEKTITLRSTFFDNEKTLTGEVIKELENLIINSLKDAGFNLK